MKKFTIISLLVVFPFFCTGCDDYLDVNHNIDAPDYVEGYLYLSGVIQAYQDIYYDLRAVAPMIQMMGTTGFTSFAGHYYYPTGTSADNGGQIWRTVYWNQGMNLENLINQSIAAEDWTLAGIGLTLKAFSWDMLTKLHSDLPMTDAYVPELLAHRYDYQDAIYPQIREWAYKAIEYLETPDDHVYGSRISANDWIYKGDINKWKKLAYAVLVRNLASLSNKTDFTSKYAQELIDCAGKSFQNADDDAVVSVAGGSSSAAFAMYNNFWGTARANLSRTYFQHDYAVQVMTGSVPKYDQLTGNKIPVTGNTYYPVELADAQIVCDTLKDVPGHYDPRMVVKLGTTNDPTFDNITNAESIKSYQFYGGSSTGTLGPIGSAPSYFGRNASSTIAGTVHDGKGRWIYRDDAPYILTTCAEVKFCLAEAYWKIGNKAEALAAFKEGVKADLEFTARYITPGTRGQAAGGDKITKEVFNALATEYVDGPYVNGLTQNDFTLSHIMMQKWVSLYPWGAFEAWTDMRKYHYDLAYTGEYPKKDNGWERSAVYHKWDVDPDKVYKGFYLVPAQVQNRKGTYNIDNDGSPCYRLRPRYNSEYMWNIPSLKLLKPISGTAPDYHCSIPWFAYPGDYPAN
ncbi:hypothetical protein EZS27_015926 [termite gut metagenome]|uniref:SusD/RagB family nutrient-binding outer membrane lipoprotein n=1 Tax=termite gut metagenome TaxID=433724 RepID=A0A5J4RS00_9ZZZZ